MPQPLLRPTIAIAAFVVAACAGQSFPSPTGSTPLPGPTTAASGPWIEAPIDQPAAVLDAPSLSPGYQCHPCHYLAENDLFAVARWPQGFITVGVQKPPAQAVAFTSSDGTHWSPAAGFAAPEGTSATATVSDEQRTVLVGIQHSGAMSWAFDGAAWQQAPDQEDLRVDYAAGGMLSVIHFQDGFVAGGYADDPLHNKAYAAVWRSSDGLTWHKDATDQGVFDGGRIWAMTATGDTIVAVGSGDGNPTYGPAAAWRWTAATGWQRAQLPDGIGALAAVLAGSTRFVAVGKNADDLGASVVTSSDGESWKAVADQPGLHYYELPLRMQALVATPTGILVGGWRSDVGKGSAVTWFTQDTAAWPIPTWETSFSGGQITGVALDPDTGMAVAVGRTGYPDWNRATAWFMKPPF
jgi:hypothetical protein